MENNVIAVWITKTHSGRDYFSSRHCESGVIFIIRLLLLALLSSSSSSFRGYGFVLLVVRLKPQQQLLGL